VVQKRSASKERESKCNESRRISKLRSPGSSCNTPCPEVEGGYEVTFSWRSGVLVSYSEEVEERKVLWARGVYSSEEPLSEKLSVLNPKPRFNVSLVTETGPNDSFGPSSVYMGVCGPEVVEMDEGVQEVERRVGVV